MNTPELQIAFSLSEKKIIEIHPPEVIAQARKIISDAHPNGSSRLKGVVEYPDTAGDGTEKNIVMLFSGFKDPKDNGWVSVRFTGPADEVNEKFEEFKAVSAMVPRSEYLKQAPPGVAEALGY